MRQAWGQDSVGYYSADTFNEQSPPSAEPDYLRNASRGVYEVLAPPETGCSCCTPYQTVKMRFETWACLPGNLSAAHAPLFGAI